MKIKDLEKLRDENNKDFIKFYAERILEELKETMSKERKNKFYLILVLLVFFLIKFIGLKEINIGFLMLKNTNIIMLILPLVYVWLLVSIQGLIYKFNDINKVLSSIYEKELLIDFYKKKDKLSPYYLLLVNSGGLYALNLLKDKWKENKNDFLLIIVLYLPSIMTVGLIYIALFYMIFNMLEELSSWFSWALFLLTILELVYLISLMITREISKK